jgi:hypothetical protein
VNQQTLELRCALVGLGAWGPGFTDWPSLSALLLQTTPQDESAFITSTPKPEVIPANERRRAPLPVKAAVDVSWQALQQSGIASSEVACVFGSGLGDTEITDYMCRVLTTAEKQLSPTKFHNSVHNAAAGYWTISTHCMKSANSIAAYHMTAGLAMLEAMTQCVLHNEPVLITLFDTAAHDAYRQIFDCEHNFAAALLITPIGFNPAGLAGASKAATPLAELTLTQALAPVPTLTAQPEWHSPTLTTLYQTNPAAKILNLLAALAQFETDKKPTQAQLALSASSSINLALKAAAV